MSGNVAQFIVGASRNADWASCTASERATWDFIFRIAFSSAKAATYQASEDCTGSAIEHLCDWKPRGGLDEWILGICDAQ